MAFTARSGSADGAARATKAISTMHTSLPVFIGSRRRMLSMNAAHWMVRGLSRCFARARVSDDVTVRLRSFAATPVKRVSGVTLSASNRFPSPPRLPSYAAPSCVISFWGDRNLFSARSI